MNNTFSILDFGAREGTLSTAEIQCAFDAASASCGTVVIPKGTYITGTIDMGCASLYLEKGAVLMGSPDPRDYRHNGYAHNEMRRTTSLLYAMDVSGIRVSGQGTIDLNGQHFYHADQRQLPEYDGEISEEQRLQCTMKYDFRPTQPIFFLNCRDITFQDITILNAPCWTMSFNNCENIRITDLTILNDRAIPNNDGMHFCGCRRVFVRGCNIESGDDCVALSGITDWNIPCEDVVISDCVFRSTSKAIVIGYTHSIVRHVTISNVIIRDSQRGVCIMSSTDTGLVEDVTVQNLQLETHIRAGNWWGNGEPVCIFGLYHHNLSYLLPAPDRHYPVNIRNIHFSNIICQGENVIGIVGTGENVRDITVDGLYFTRLPSANAYLKGENTVDVSPALEKAFIPDSAPDYWLFAEGCRNIRFKNVHSGHLKPYIIHCKEFIIEE